MVTYPSIFVRTRPICGAKIGYSFHLLSDTYTSVVLFSLYAVSGEQIMKEGTDHQVLWAPAKEIIDRSNITRFIHYLRNKGRWNLGTFEDLAAWSRNNSEAFYSELWDFSEIRAESRGEKVITNPNQMPGAEWFPEAKLNFAENLLRRRDNSTALIFQGEMQVYGEVTWNVLYNTVSRLSQALKADGVKTEDRVVAFMPNMPETVMAMLAATSIGAVWSSCSPDFGVKGVMDRFGQIHPTVLVAANGYFYNGKEFDCLERIKTISKQIPSLKRIIIVPYTESNPDLSMLPDAISWSDYIAKFSSEEIKFAQLPFNHPLYIMYSSGTTGVPKCIVHGAGGTLLQHLKEHLFHTDLRPKDHLFFFTTCGWMMWNWMISGLGCQATIVLYDGSPFCPDINALWNLADRAQINVFGTSAKYLDACRKSETSIAQTHDLSSIDTILSTGSPLAPSSFDYVYTQVKNDVRLSSISGGTDIVGCFASGSSVLPVRRGEIQTLALGMKVEVYDEDGVSVIQQKGELVCTAPFPSMPIGLWDDPDGKLYSSTYFSQFSGVWTHGDYCEITEHGGMIIYGRSDAILNPGGVRIGTAEIYRQVESMDEVVEGPCVAQDWDNDVRVVLFVRLREGQKLDDSLREAIRDRIKTNATPRHVPHKIISVADIPRTISGKITELAVRDVIHGRSVKNLDALANPEALKLYEGIVELEK